MTIFLFKPKIPKKNLSPKIFYPQKKLESSVSFFSFLVTSCLEVLRSLVVANFDCFNISLKISPEDLLNLSVVRC